MFLNILRPAFYRVSTVPKLEVDEELFLDSGVKQVSDRFMAMVTAVLKLQGMEGLCSTQ